MPTDRYTKTVLTVIAGALLYLCIVMTPIPSVQAQGALRPGDISSAPINVVVTGWQFSNPMPVAFQQPVQVSVANETLRVVTERSSGAADRVVVVGWEQNASREKPAAPSNFNSLRAPAGTIGIPVSTPPR